MRRDGLFVELLTAIDPQLGLQLLDAAAQHADLDVGLCALRLRTTIAAIAAPGCWRRHRSPLGLIAATWPVGTGGGGRAHARVLHHRRRRRRRRLGARRRAAR